MPNAWRNWSRGNGSRQARAASAEKTPVVAGRKKNIALRAAPASVHDTSSATTNARIKAGPSGARPCALSSSTLAIRAAKIGGVGRITPGS